MKKMNNSLYRPIAALHGAEKERAEFMFKANDFGSYDFLSLLINGKYNSISQEYEKISLPANTTHPWRRRHKWKVGMTVDGIHWGVYVSRCPTEDDPEDDSSSVIERKGMDVPPVGVYKVYGANWSGKKDQAMHLQAVWSSHGELKRDLEEKELTFVTKRNSKDLFKDALYDEKEMYFSWPEFVLVAQFLLQEWLLKFTAKVDSTTDRATTRENLVQYNNTPAAYSIFRNNCRHFSGELMDRLMHNQWTDKSRLKYDFSFHSLSNEWTTLTNIWALVTDSTPQPRAISKARSKSQQTKQPYPAIHRSADLEAMKQKLPGMKRIFWRRLRSQLDRDPDAIDMAVSFINVADLSIGDYVKLLRTDATESAVNAIKQEYEDIALPSPSEAVIQSWVVTFRSLWERQNSAFDLLLFLSCTTGHKVHQELLPRSGTLREDIEALKSLGLLEAGKNEITVRFPVWEIMIFGISVWAKCSQSSLRTGPSDVYDSDLKLQAARKAIDHMCSLATKGTSDKEWWRRNGQQIREVLREWQEDHSQHTKQTSTVNQFVGQNLFECGDVEQAIRYLRFTVKFCDSREKGPVHRTTYHFAQLDLCRALRQGDDESLDLYLKETKKMLKKNEWINKYLDRKGPTKPASGSPRIWLDEWQYVPELCLELAHVYMKIDKPQKACDILDKLAMQLDIDFPLTPKTSSKVSARFRSFLAKAGGQSKASDRADELYSAMEIRLGEINKETADGSNQPTPSPSQTNLER